MDICDAPVSMTRALTEQIARQLFDVLPEGGPVLLIMDRDGHCWSSDAEELARLNLDPALLKDLRAKVDDGVEPVVTRIGDTSVTVAQLATDRTNCGYVVVALPKCGAEPTLTHANLVEVLVNQIALIARLIEQADTIARTQVHCYKGYDVPAVPLN